MRVESWYTADEAVAAGLCTGLEVDMAEWEAATAHLHREAWQASVRHLFNAATAIHHVGTEDSAWDAAAAVKAMPNTASVLRSCFAWRDPKGDPDAKESYRFPHHRRQGGPANLAACRNGLARLPGSKIDDKDGVEAHLRAHLDDAKNAAQREWSRATRRLLNL
jgi:hypothetical protein